MKLKGNGLCECIACHLVLRRDSIKVGCRYEAVFTCLLQGLHEACQKLQPPRIPPGPPVQDYLLTYSAHQPCLPLWGWDGGSHLNKPHDHPLLSLHFRNGEDNLSHCKDCDK